VALPNRRLAKVAGEMEGRATRYALVAACLLAGLLTASAAWAKGGHFESKIRAVKPAVSGLKLTVLEDDKYFHLQNETGRTVVVDGYDGEPYLRFRPDGVVERNSHSPATYLNANRYGGQKVPPSASPSARPRWGPAAKNGTFTWFDHRIHLTLKRPPPEVAKAKKRKKIFDWEVPLTVGGRPARVVGTLVWEPASSSGGFPVWLVVVLAAAVLLALAAILLLRRRRPAAAGLERREEPAREAW
jgi:hypothetical protein